MTTSHSNRRLNRAVRRSYRFGFGEWRTFVSNQKQANMSNKKGAIIEFTAYREVFAGHPFIGVEFGKNGVTYDIERFEQSNDYWVKQVATLRHNTEVKVRGKVVAVSTQEITVSLGDSDIWVHVWHGGNYDGIKFIDDEK